MRTICIIKYIYIYICIYTDYIYVYMYICIYIHVRNNTVTRFTLRKKGAQSITLFVVSSMKSNLLITSSDITGRRSVQARIGVGMERLSDRIAACIYIRQLLVHLVERERKMLYTNKRDHFRAREYRGESTKETQE